MKNRLFTYGIIFFSGFFLTLAVVYYSEWRYEEDILDSMANRAILSAKGKGIEDAVDSAMSLTHKVVDPMADVYGNEKFGIGKDFFISPSFLVYYYGQGACGGYAAFTARLLNKMNIKTKFVLQTVGGVPGGHITLVIEDGSKLLLVDPLFAWTFRDSMGHMSDINQVAANWPYYAKFKPKLYRSSYNYQNGWTYTNWNKLGIFSKSAYKIGVLIFGKQKMDRISIRAYFLGATKKYFYACIGLCMCFLAFLVNRYIKYRSMKHRNYTSVNSIPLSGEQLNEMEPSLEYLPK
jgi:hypothetical protein